ncbi:MAG TPA: PQQ-dependent sugar dehydrogenase [Candidatus Absconditabacterales bacterium]|nr:PQQ-dependent sugar dehydrogenase [Candidatus Absconditabacterales bacterium]HMT27100.1 PQQ-dependent sugar dehydrogenase [Candidatus Absconditabacterales bacterium]
MKKLIGFISLIFLFFGVYRVRDYLNPANDLSLDFVNKISTGIDQKIQRQEKTGFQISVVVENLFVPWSMVFTSNERIIVTQRNGEIVVINSGVVQSGVYKKFADVSVGGEQGLMGLALDPDYQNNKFFYVSYAYLDKKNIALKVVRLKDFGSFAGEEKTIVDFLPAAQFHAGSKIKFGPDGKLYITLGDAIDKELAQNTEIYNGKILRINNDGSIPVDNPFSGSAIWSLGHRNPQGIDRDSQGNLYSAEHGPSVFDGPPGGDELNLIVKGGNYGRPKEHHQIFLSGFNHPLQIFTPAIAPSGILVYKGTMFPERYDSIFLAMLKGEGILRFTNNKSDPSKIIGYEKLTLPALGRIRDISEAPDGSLYFTTSNLDGRGEPRSGDDKIYRIWR